MYAARMGKTSRIWPSAHAFGPRFDERGEDLAHACVKEAMEGFGSLTLGKAQQLRDRDIAEQDRGVG